MISTKGVAKTVIIKKRLVFCRGIDTIVVDEGNNFQGLFDISSIGGTLTFNLPVIKREKDSKTLLSINNLRKFDYVFLFYAEVEEINEEPKNNEWKTIFNGYIESIKFKKTKDSMSYSFTCNSMLALSSYMYFPRSFEAIELAEAPKLILQRANMQLGPYNEVLKFGEVSEIKNIIPQEMMDIQINEFLGGIVIKEITDNNCKDALCSLRDKYGLILTENMDGVVQVTTLTNYMSDAKNYEFKIVYDDRTPLKRATDWYLNSQLQTLKVTKNILLGLVQIVADFFSLKKAKNAIPAEIKSGSQDTGHDNIYEALKSMSNKSQILQANRLNQDLVKLGRGYKINALEFRINYNVFEVDYPDISCEYDGVLVYGEFAVGKAIDLTTVLMKDLKPEALTGAIKANMLRLYRRDINSEMELNKIAREYLLKIKQENRIRIKVKFEPFYRIGMPFVFIDDDRYMGNDLFFISRISYTISKDDVYCVLEGISSILNTLPKSVVVDDLNVSDVRFIKDKSDIDLYTKLPNDAWQNF